MTTLNATKPDLKHILIIEDEGDMCLLLDVLLKSRDAKVAHVKNLFDAYLFLQKRQPDLVLLDNRLPDGYGIDLISYIKANHPQIKIIMISGVDAAAQDVALEIGADTFLPKPFSKQQLDTCIDQLIN